LKPKVTKYFSRTKRNLRKSQIRQLDQEIEKILKNPQIGESGREELEHVKYYRYEDDYGRMLLSYAIQNNIILFYSITRLSIKI
jgi:hypothetical protein